MTIIDLRNVLNSMIECGFGERTLEPGFNIWDYIRDEPHPFPVVDGDIFESGADIIAHQVNCQGVMGSGVAKQVKEKYPALYSAYREDCLDAKTEGYSLLGNCLLYDISEDGHACIANLFGQENFGYDGKCYTDYDKLRESLHQLYADAKILEGEYGKTMAIAIPYLMGCHRGGGDWEIVSKMIEEELAGCDVTYYRYTAG